MNCRSPGLTLDLTASWILLSAWASITGWILSAFQLLNGPGYLGSGLLAVIWLVVGCRTGRIRLILFPFHWQRFRRLIPGLWLGLAVLIFAGGAIYAPNNYDYLTYRFPRVLHWMWEQQWHWIATDNNRINFSGTGFEWLMAPLFVFFKTDRLFFLINFIPWLLMPGLVFSVFRNLGLHGRTCWYMMWLLPSAYCYAIQAGSAGNDSFAAIYLLASLHFAFRARRLQSSGYLLLSILAAALLTGAKASNLPLLLPCVLAMMPALRLLVLRPYGTPLVLAVALLSSFVPMAVLNHCYNGHWSGDKNNETRMMLGNPLAGVSGNAIQIGMAALAPPVFPIAGWWNKHATEYYPAGVEKWLKKEFPRFGPGLGEIPLEEGAGLGLGLTLLLAAALVLFRGKPQTRRIKAGWWIMGGGLLALLVYMARVGSESGARLVAAYYPLLIAAILSCISFPVFRKGFRIFAGLAVLSAYPVVILTPARPLFPAKKVVMELKKHGINHPVLDRAEKVYTVYAERSDSLGPVRKLLPENIREVDFLQSGDDSEVALWRPWGSRRVGNWKPEKGAEWVVVSSRALKYRFNQGSDEWADENGYEIMSAVKVAGKVQEGPVEWLIVKKRGE